MDAIFLFLFHQKKGIAIEKNNGNYSNDLKIDEMIISDDKLIDSINLAAFDAENKNKGLVISRSEEELTLSAKRIGKQIIKKEIA